MKPTRRQDHTAISPNNRSSLLCQSTLAVALGCSAFGQTYPWDKPVAHDVSWIGNTYGSGSGVDRGEWVQEGVTDIWVHPSNGTEFAISSWDEGHREAGIYRNGKVLGDLPGLHMGAGGRTARAITGSVTTGHVYVANGTSIRRYTMPVINTSTDTITTAATYAPFSGGTNSGSDGGATLELDSGPRGLSLTPDGSVLYASMPDTGTVKVINTSTMTVTNEFSVPGAYRIAVSPQNGSLWIAIRATGVYGQPGFVAGKVVRYSNTGALLTQDILGPAGFDPVSLAFMTPVTPGDPYLAIADNGRSQRVHLYRALGAVHPGDPIALVPFGEDRGVLASPAGWIEPVVGSVRFNGPTGIGYDSAGNFYIAQNRTDPEFNANMALPTGCIIECYGPLSGNNRTRIWDLHGLEFVDCVAALTPNGGAPENLLFPKFSSYQMDYSLEPGREWTHRTHTLDRFTYPYDPRWTYIDQNFRWLTAHSARQITIGTVTHTFVYMLDMYGDRFSIFRKNGEILVPCGTICLGDTSKSQSRHPGAPTNTGHWIWRDRDGDGTPETGTAGAPEYQVFTGTAYDIGCRGYSVAPNGDIWFGKRDGAGATFSARIPFGGVDSFGTPIYTVSSIQSFGNVAGMSRICRTEFIPAAGPSPDRLLVVGYKDPDYPSISVANPVSGTEGFTSKSVGKYMALINNPVSSGRTVAWGKAFEPHVYRLPGGAKHENFDEIAPTSDTLIDNAVGSIRVAGDYVFVGYVGERQNGGAESPQAASIEIYTLSGGVYVGKIETAFESSGLIDVCHGMEVVKQASGHYLIYVEENKHGKIAMYRWHPSNVRVESSDLADDNATVNILPPAASSGDALSYGSDVQASGGSAVKYAANAVEDYVTYSLGTLTIGTPYKVTIRVKTNGDRGIIKLYGQNGNTSATPVALGNPAGYDLYAPGGQNGFIDLPSYDYTPGSTGLKFLRLEVSGKNASSSNYSISIDSISLSRQ